MDIAEQMSKPDTQEPDPIEKLTETMLKLMVEDHNVTSDSPGATAGVPVAKVPVAFSDVTPRTAILFNQIANGQYKDLGHTDDLVNARCQEVLSRLDSLASPDRAVDRDVLRFLEEEDVWLKTSLAKIKIFVAANQSVALLKNGLVERLEDIIDAVSCYKLILSKRSSDHLHEEPSIYDAGHCYHTDVGNTHRATLLACLNVLVLNLFGHVTHRWCNFTLKMLHTILQEAYSGDGRNLTAREIKILENFPHDIRTVRKAFDIEAKTTTYAACPQCNCTYAPSVEAGLAIYPSHCTWREFPTSEACAESLTDSRIVEGQSMRYPKRPFVVQDFDAFVANLLSRPGVEEALDHGTVLLNQDELNDIKDGAGVQNLRGPDGQPFLDSLQRSELRLVWSLSVDWFNPHTNKIAGKHVSTGSIAMACLNLPPSLRYKPEFMYLNSVMPVEPTLDQSNHYLTPIITQLERSYTKGVKCSRTYKHRQGRQTRSAIAVFVNDLPGGKKVAQMASHSSKSHFCSLCTLHKDRISETDPELWVPRDSGALRRAAYAWKNATSKAERDAIFAKFGVRWSELWRLSYYDPIRMLIIDGMHNLFEGLVQFHCRYLLAINENEAGSGDVVNPTTKEMDEAKKILGSPASSASTKGRIKFHVLKALCRERDLLPEQPGFRLSKKYMMDLLLQTLPAGTDVPPTTGALSTDELSNSTETATLTSYEEIIGSEYIDEVEQLYKHTIGDDGITAEELEHLRAALRSTTRPTWQRGPPMNFGSAAHGKLKADQWRSAIEFDVPVLLAQLWSFSDAEVLIDERKRRRRLVLASTMLLATAIRWGTSDVASQAHAENYTQHMKAYLDILLHLYPAFKLKPNHHAALHIGFFLREFGPMRGWWMYPFERIIGILQKTNTNSKLGQMEKTMLQSFCAAANLKALLRGSEIPAVNQCASQVEKISELFSPDGNVPEAIAARGNDVSSRERRAERLHPDIQAALMAKEILWKSRIDGWRTPTQAFRHRRITVGAFEFASYTESRSLGSIFFKPDDSQILTPGKIQEIFAVETLGHDGVGREDILCVIKRHTGQPQSITCTPSMLGVFEEFGAHIWPSDLSDQLDIVPFTGALYHSIGRSWSEGMVVLKPMNRAFGKRDFSDTDRHV